MAPILALPGLLCTAALWDEVLAAIGRDARCPTYPAADSLDTIAEGVLEDAPPRFLALGHSMGGYLALSLLRRVPERLAGLCLLGATAAADRPEQQAARVKAVAQAERAGIGAFATRLGAWLMASPAVALPRFVAMAEETGLDRFRAHQAAIAARPDSRPLLAAATCPILIATGEADPLFPPAAAQELAAASPGAVVAILPGCGHLAPIEAPAAMARALRPWLARCEAPDHRFTEGERTP